MTKKLLILLATSAFALSAQAALFDGSTDAFYSASGTGGTQDFSLSNSSGTVTYTNTSGANAAGYVFGALSSDTTLSNTGDYIELSFTAAISTWPNAADLSFSLVGERAGTIASADNDLEGFTRRFAGMSYSVLTNTIDYTISEIRGTANRLAGPEDRSILTQGGTDQTALSTGSGAGNPWPASGDRQNSGETAAFTFRVENAGSGQFTISATGQNITDSTGTIVFPSSTFTPADSDFFLTTDAFSHFAIGTSSDIANGESLTLSNVTVTAIPEPSTFALVGLALGAILLFRRRS